MTIQRPVRIEGVGLHGGLPVRVAIMPSRSGIRFLVPGGAFRALAGEAGESDHRTVLRGAGGLRVETPEHLLCALYALGIGHADICVDGHEIPILDGSVQPWLDALAQAGLAPAPALPVHVPSRVIEIRSGRGWIRAVPSGTRSLRLALDFGKTGPGQGVVEAEGDLRAWAARNARARTFAWESQVAQLRARGLALGGSLDNALVYGSDGIPLNPGGERMPGESMVHKALDLLGDLALLPFDWKARIEADKPGHALSAALARAMSEDFLRSQARAA